MFKRRSSCATASVLTLAILALSGQRATAGPLQVLVPAYFYPVGNPYWGQLTSAASVISVNAILNPASGPGSAPDPNYVTAVDNLRAAGGRVFGYVHTSYTARPESGVEAEINDYLGPSAFYHVDGIFIDEMTNDPSAAHLSYYHDLYNYIKSLNSSALVIGNPGTNTQQAYLTEPTADILVTFENTSAVYQTYTPDSWVFGYSAGHFAHIIHTAPLADLATDLNLAMQRNAGYVYVTDATLPNPYDRLPSYWDQEVAGIEASIPEPATGITASLASLLLVLVGRFRKRQSA